MCLSSWGLWTAGCCHGMQRESVQNRVSLSDSTVAEEFLNGFPLAAAAV